MEREPSVVIVDVYCSNHGHIGRMASTDIRDVVDAHREKNSCNGQMTVDIESHQKTSAIDENNKFND